MVNELRTFEMANTNEVYSPPVAAGKVEWVTAASGFHNDSNEPPRNIRMYVLKSGLAYPNRVHLEALKSAEENEPIVLSRPVRLTEGESLLVWVQQKSGVHTAFPPLVKLWMRSTTVDVNSPYEGW